MELTDQNFDQTINSGEKLILVDFFAVWCEPCSILGPILEKVAGEFSNDITFYKVNLDQAPLAAQKFGVDRIPTVILFNKGKAVSGFTGALPEQNVRDWLKNVVKK